MTMSATPSATPSSSIAQLVAGEPAIVEAPNGNTGEVTKAGGETPEPSQPPVDTLTRLTKPDYKSISNSTSLLSLLDSYEGMIDIIHRQTIYATTYPFTNVDLQNLAWLFTYGKLDGWTDRIAQFYVLASSRDYTPPLMPERIEIPILRMSAALRVLSQQEEDKVKYVIVVQNKNMRVSHKLLVSHSRKAAGMDIFYELLNGNSVIFIGLVLKHVAVPTEAPHKYPVVPFTRVDSIKAALSVAETGDGKVGILC